MSVTLNPNDIVSGCVHNMNRPASIRSFFIWSDESSFPLQEVDNDLQI